MFLKTHNNPVVIVQYISGHKLEVVDKISTKSDIAFDPIEDFKQYMLDSIKSVRQTRQQLKHQYPDLFSSYA